MQINFCIMTFYLVTLMCSPINFMRLSFTHLWKVQILMYQSKSHQQALTVGGQSSPSKGLTCKLPWLNYCCLCLKLTILLTYATATPPSGDLPARQNSPGRKPSCLFRSKIQTKWPSLRSALLLQNRMIPRQRAQSQLGQMRGCLSDLIRGWCFLIGHIHSVLPLLQLEKSLGTSESRPEGGSSTAWRKSYREACPSPSEHPYSARKLFPSQASTQSFHLA